MCLGGLLLDSSGAVHAAADQSAVTWFYGNARGLRQTAGELRQQVNARVPDFIGITEAHTDGDPAKPTGT